MTLGHRLSSGFIDSSWLKQQDGRAVTLDERTLSLLTSTRTNTWTSHECDPFNVHTSPCLTKRALHLALRCLHAM